VKPSAINCAADKANVVFVGADNDISSPAGQGADKGPAAVRSCLEGQIEFREHRTGIVAVERLKIGWLDLGDLNGNRDATSLGEAVSKVCAACQLAHDSGQFPFVIGGDHSNAIGAVMAVGQKYDPRQVTVVHIDAHHDLRYDDGDCADPPLGRLAHGCALRHAAEVGFSLVQIGIRSYSREEAEYARQNRRVTAFYWGGEADFRPPTARNILKAVKTELVYLTVDVDGIDPSFMPATGRPVSGGLGWWYAWDLLQAICQEKRLVGADICEVSPRPPDRLTERNAAQLAYNIVTWALLAKKKTVAGSP